jgi:hypothetical protein
MRSARLAYRASSTPSATGYPLQTARTSPIGQTSDNYSARRNFGIFRKAHPPPESSTLPVSPVEPDVINPWLGGGSQFGLEKLLQILGLLPETTETNSGEVRHRLDQCGATM